MSCVCCLWFVFCGSLIVSVVNYVLPLVSCSLSVVRCSLFVVCCLWCAVSGVIPFVSIVC